MSDNNVAAANNATLSETEQILEEMWTEAAQEIGSVNPQTENWKIQALPLARIKKIMKSEEFILQELEKDRQREEGVEAEGADKTGIKFMISAEAPLLMSKACELLIKELAHRAWQHTERNRRRTLQRQDIHAAVGESEVFDFLIDIVPRVATSRTPGAQPPVDAQHMPNVPQLHAPPGNDPDAVAQQQQAPGNVEGMQEGQNPPFNAQLFQYVQGEQNDQGDGNQPSQQPAQPWTDHAAM